jgi:DNA repair protein RecO (recombination protein O)
MGYFYTQGIIINTEPLNERDKIAVFLTEDLGKIRVKFRSVRSSKSKRSGFSEDFINEKVLLYKKQNFFIATEVSLIDAYTGLKNSIEDYKILTYIKEILLTLLPYEQPEPKVFNLLSTVLDCLKISKYKNSVTIYFCMYLFEFLGFPILLPEVIKGDYFFSPGKGGFNKTIGTRVNNFVVKDFVKIYKSKPCEFGEILDFDAMFGLINSFVLFHSDSEHYKNFLKAFERI